MGRSQVHIKHATVYRSAPEKRTFQTEHRQCWGWESHFYRTVKEQQGETYSDAGLFTFILLFHAKATFFLRNLYLSFWLWQVLVVDMDPELLDSVVAALRLVALACGIFVPWRGIEPMSPALQRRLLTTGQQRKPLKPLPLFHQISPATSSFKRTEVVKINE